MTRSELNQVLSWLDAGKLQIRPFGREWVDYVIGKHADIWYPSDQFDLYRQKHTPTLRPWRPEEVPVGAIVRDPKYNSVWLITALWEQHKGSGDYRVFLNGGNYEEGHKLEYFTDDKMLYSLDHGKTWLPCGVAE